MERFVSLVRPSDWDHAPVGPHQGSHCANYQWLALSGNTANPRQNAPRVHALRSERSGWPAGPGRSHHLLPTSTSVLRRRPGSSSRRSPSNHPKLAGHRSEQSGALRARSAWTDVADRIAHFSEYFRSAEHSAQQPPSKLRRYEREFKSGQINVLNCSTTMEMGVDIGSVSHVMMTNLPPSIANYRQRVGRAGRRGQALSLAFTFCRDRPLERDAFRDPIKYLARTMLAPSVALQSTVVVQRHVNAFLFSAFITERGADALKMETGPFFGCLEDVGVAEQIDNPASHFAAWLRDPRISIRYDDDLIKLTRKSFLEGDGGVYEVAAQAIEKAREAFAHQWRVVQELASARGDDKACD